MRRTSASVHSRARAARAELTFEEMPFASQSHEDGGGFLGAKRVAAGEVRGAKRRVRARIPERQISKRIANRLEERVRNAAGQRCAERVPIAGGILDGDQAIFVRHPDADRAARGHEQLRGFRGVDDLRAFADLVERQIAKRDQHVVNSVDRLHAILFVESLKLALDRVHRIGIEQFAKLGVADELAKLRLVDGERLRPALGERRVAVVEKAGHVAEKQRCGERRRLLGIDRREADPPASQIGERLHEGWHIEKVAKALAIGFKDHGERAETRGHGKKVRGALALLPEGHAAARPAFRKKKRPRGVLPELARKERRSSELTDDERLDFVGVRNQQPRIGRRIHIRKPHHESIVAPERLDVDAGFFADLRCRRHGPGRVNGPAAR